MQKQKALNYILSGVVLYLTVVACGDSSNSDTSKPVITMLGTSPVEVIINSTYTDAGATADDAEDGDITANIVTGNSVVESTVGTYTVTYDVTDSDQQVADQVVRTVNVVSNLSPVITLQGISPLDTPLDFPYVDDGASAADAEDGDITANIVTVNSVDVTIPGIYTVTYDVTDSGGAVATQVVRTVNVNAATDGSF